MNADEDFSWYESNLPSKERKARGHFSTPPALIEQMLDACGYVSSADLSSLRVLDPACGSGNFLVCATRRLIGSGKQQTLPRESILASAQRNIWGFDPDPISCFLAEMQVRVMLSAALFDVNDNHMSAKDVGAYQLHIHQADGLVFPWEPPETVDLFLANPPYLAAKNNDLSGYRSTQGRGQVDSYLLFLNLALQVVKPHGWIGLILPDPVLARANAAQERQRLLQEMTIHHLWHLSAVFPAYVGAVVIIAQKVPPKHTHQVACVRDYWDTTSNLQQAPTSKITQTMLLKQPRAELRYLLGSTQHTLVGRLYERYTHPSISPPLSDHHATGSLLPLNAFVSICRGEELGKTNTVLSGHPQEMFLQQACLSKEQEQVWYPVLRGGVDVRPYAQPVAQRWIVREAISKPITRYLTPKLLVVKSTGKLQATLDTQGHVVLQTLYLLSVRKHESEMTRGQQIDVLYFLLALLNSYLLQEYVYVLYTAYKWVQPQIEQHVLAHLPIPFYGKTRQRAEIIERAKVIMAVCSGVASVVELEEQSKGLREEQERAICALYEDVITK